MSAPSSSLPSAAASRRSEYTYRRALAPLELLPAVGAGVAAGLAAFYVVRELLARTPFEVEPLRERRPPPAYRPDA